MKRLAMMLLAATAILVSACGIDRSESMGTVPIDPPPATSPSTVDPEGSATTTAPPGPTGRSPAVQPARATTVSLALHEPAAAEVSAVRAPPAVAGQAAAVSVRPFLSDVTLAPEGGSVLREVVLSGSEHANDVQVRVTFDLSGLAGVATMAEPSGCATSGQTVTCDTRVSFGMWATAATWVRLSPAPDAREGGHGTIVVTASAAGGSGSHTATVRIGAAVDLIAGPSQSLTIRAGVSRAAPLPVRVGGSRTAHGSVVQFDGDSSYLARQNFANCHYFLGKITYCDIDTALAPGRTYDFSPQLTLRTDPAEPAGQKRMWATWHTRDQWEQVSSTLRHKGVQFGWPGTGPRLALAPRPGTQTFDSDADVDHSNNGTQLDVVLVTDRRGDLAAIGTTVRAVGVDQVRIKVGVRNVGSASVNFQPPSQDQHPVIAYISLPGNTFGLRAPYDCAGAGAGPDGWAWEDPGRPSSRYACIRGVPLRPGDTAWIELTVTVNRNAPNRPGTIETTRGENVANNKANIVVLTTAADLPITGPRTALTISLGAGALLAGALTMLATSRRRNRDHRPQPSR